MQVRSHCAGAMCRVELCVDQSVRHVNRVGWLICLLHPCEQGRVVNMSAAPDSAEASCPAMVGLFAAAADHKLHGCFGKYGIQVSTVAFTSVRHSAAATVC